MNSTYNSLADFINSLDKDCFQEQSVESEDHDLCDNRDELHSAFCNWGYATLKIVPMYAHLNLSCSKRGGAKGLPYAQACHVGCV